MQSSAYQNSFKLPKDTVPFSKIKNKVDEILAGRFEKMVYDPKITVLELKEAVNEINTLVKENISQRFKYAIQSNIVEKIGQAVFSGNMCLWDAEHDNYISTQFETPTFMVIVIIFCSLLE